MVIARVAPRSKSLGKATARLEDRAARVKNPLLKAIAELDPKKIRKPDLKALLDAAGELPKLLPEHRIMIGDAFVTREPTDKAREYYMEVLVRDLGFPKPKHLRASIFGGP